ncbi:MAG: hypothetical protein ABDH20_00240 [Thermus sp.]
MIMKKWMWLMVWILLIGVLGSVYAQRATVPSGPRFFLETGTVATMELFFAQETAFGMQLGFQGGVKDLAGPFGVGGQFGLGVQGGGAAFNLGLEALLHFGQGDLVPLVGAGFRVFFGGGQTAFGLGAAAGAEFAFNRNVSLVATIRPTLWFAGGAAFGMSIGTGFRIYP